jgi:hypothetical protein
LLPATRGCIATPLPYGAPGFAPAGAANEGKPMTKLLAALPLILLAACDSSPDVKMKNASVGEVAKEMRKAAGEQSFIDPGKWQQTMTLLEVDAPGMPPEAKAMMQKAMDKARVHELCLSPEDAKRPKEDFFAKDSKDCRYEHFNWGDGKIDLKLLCKHGATTTNMTMVGSYQPNAYSMTMTTTNQGAGAVENMAMKMKIDAKRTGDCDGKEKLQVGN